MLTIIIDSCSYTRLGLTGYLLNKGVRKREANGIETVDDLTIACDSQRLSVMSTNEDYFIHNIFNGQRVKHIINQYPNTLFVAFMAIADVYPDGYLLVRENLLISPKLTRSESLDDILGDILKEETTITSLLDMPTLSLSRTESSMLRVWTAGQGTIQIPDQTNIKVRTVSSHEGSAKRKIKTYNKQVIYHAVRLTDNVTSGVFTNVR